MCIHVYEQIQSGTSQAELLDKALDVESLFTRDLQKLTAQEKTCLKHIAENTPADWFETIEIFGNDVLQALMKKRLVIRRGNKINLILGYFPRVRNFRESAFNSFNLSSKLQSLKYSTDDSKTTFKRIAVKL